LTLNSPGTAQLIADVSGYYLPGPPSTAGAFGAVTPTRLLDTRIGRGATGPVASAGTLSLRVTGGMVPTGAGAVLLNVTETGSTSLGNVSVYPGNLTTPPTTSSLNLVKGQTVANAVVVPVAPDGTVKLTVNSPGSVQLIADLSGYFLSGTPTASGAFGTLTPTRLLDTRVRIGLAQSGPLQPNSTFTLPVTGGVVPVGAGAVVLNVTETGATSLGTVSVYPGNLATPPGVSSLNFISGQTVANAVVVPVAADGTVKLHLDSPGSAQLIVDVSGYFLADVQAPVSAANAATSTSSTITLNWTNPTTPGFNGVLIRRTVGSVAPASPTDGTFVTDTGSLQSEANSSIRGPIVLPTSYADTGLASSTTYSYALFAHDFSGNYTNPVDVTGSTSSTNPAPPADTTPPAPVTSLTSVVNSDTSISLSWSNPTADFAGVEICRAPTPAVQTSMCNNPVNVVSSGQLPSDHAYTDSTLSPSTQYYYTLFAFDNATPPNYSTGVTTNATTTAPTGSISGSVTTSASADLANVTVQAFDSGGVSRSTATTASNGTYTLGGLFTGTYRVCFDPSAALPASSTAYMPQCSPGALWDGNSNDPSGTPVAVTDAMPTSGIDAVIAETP